MAVKPRWQRIGLARAAFSSIYENAVASTSNEIMRETKGKPARKRKQRARRASPVWVLRLGDPPHYAAYSIPLRTSRGASVFQ